MLGSSSGVGNPVRMGVLGCAWINELAVFEPARLNAGIDIVALASRDIEKATKLAAQNGIKKAQSYDEMLTDPELEAIYIPLPNSMHCDWSIRAMEAGKAVLCEKPLASNADEALRMVEASSRTGMPLVEAFHWRYHPICHRIIDIVSSGILGAVQHIDVRVLIAGNFFSSDDIRFNYQLVGGSAMDAGCYCVNFLRLLLGEPERILSASAKLAAPQIDMHMQAELQFSSGVSSSIESSYLYDGEAFENSAEIIGTKGTLKVHNMVTPSLADSFLELVVGDRRSREKFTKTSTCFFQAKAFAEVIRNNAPILTTAEDGLATMRVLDDIYRSAGLKIRGC